MELEIERVLEKFCRYSGEALTGEDPDREELCRALCGECLEEVKARGRRRDEGSCRALESLAAAQAFYQLALVDSCGEPESVWSPELKVELGDRVRKAERLREEKRRACGSLIPEEGFYFGRA